MNNEELNETKQWLLAIGAVLGHQNRQSHKYLYKFKSGNSMLEEECIESSKQSLKESWGITSKEEMNESLGRLLDNGHSKYFDEDRNYISSLSENGRKELLKNINQRKSVAYEIVSKYDNNLPLAGIRAWDYGRYVLLCRDALLFGYFTEEEFWERLLDIGKRVQNDYSSWREYAIAYFAGREYWQDEISEDYSRTHFEYADALLFEENGPWNYLPWEMKLY